jgi:hypothetical protein
MAALSSNQAVVFYIHKALAIEGSVSGHLQVKMIAFNIIEWWRAGLPTQVLHSQVMHPRIINQCFYK